MPAFLPAFLARFLADRLPDFQRTPERPRRDHHQEHAVSCANCSGQILPPETIAATLPAPARPDRAAAMAQADPPSTITRLRSATNFMARAASSSVTTRAPSSRRRARSNMLRKTILLPMPSTNEGVYSTVRGSPAASDAARGAAVSTSAA